jgi:hypothetical protein
VTLEILENGNVLRRFTSEKRDEKTAGEAEGPVEKPLAPVAGLNRFAWDLRGLPPSLVPKAVLWGSKSGPLVAPGRYDVRLAAAGETRTASVEVVPNPAARFSREDLARQAAFLAELTAALSRTHETVRALRDARSQVAAIAKRAKKSGTPGSVAESAKALESRLLAAESELVNPNLQSSQDVLNFPPALDHQVVGLVSAVSSADAPPTAGALAYWAELKGTLAASEARAKEALTAGVAGFNAVLTTAGIPPVVALLPKGT